MSINERTKRINRMKRWTDRLNAAWEEGSLLNAASEAQCLEAEARMARDALNDDIAKNAPSYKGRSVKKSHAYAFALGGLAAVIALFFAPTAVSVSAQKLALLDEISEPVLTAELITQDEKQLLQTLRSALSDMSAGKNYPGADVNKEKRVVKNTPIVVKEVIIKEKIKIEEIKEKIKAPVQTQSAFAAEEVFSLILKGQRAMNEGSASVVVEN